MARPDRFGQLERQLQAIQHELRVSAAERRRSAVAELTAERQADEGLLRGDPFASRSAQVAYPDLASPLLTRMRADVGTSDATESALSSKNMLKDPILETILGSGPIVIGTSWTPIGGAGVRWEARKVNVSGSSPTVEAQRTANRKIMEGHIYRSDVLALDIEYAGVGECQVEVRPTVDVLAPIHIAWPFCVAAARVYVDKIVRAWTNLDDTDPLDEDEPQNWVRMAMVNEGGSFDDADEEGDEAALEELNDSNMEAQVYVGTEDIDKRHWMVLQVRTKSLGAGGICVCMAEPQINYSYQEVPMPFEWSDSASDGDVAIAIDELEHSDLDDLGADDHTQYGFIFNDPDDPGTPPRPEAIWIDEDEDGGTSGGGGGTDLEALLTGTGDMLYTGAGYSAGEKSTAAFGASSNYPNVMDGGGSYIDWWSGNDRVNITLGQSYRIGSIRCWWYPGYARATVRVSTSPDGISWTPLTTLTITGNDVTYTLPVATDARYWSFDEPGAGYASAYEIDLISLATPPPLARLAVGVAGSIIRSTGTLPAWSHPRMPTKAGVPTDADVLGGGAADGMVILDTTNHRLYVRSGGVWKYAGLT